MSSLHYPLLVGSYALKLRGLNLEGCEPRDIDLICSRNQAQILAWDCDSKKGNILHFAKGVLDVTLVNHNPVNQLMWNKIVGVKGVEKQIEKIDMGEGYRLEVEVPPLTWLYAQIKGHLHRIPRIVGNQSGNVVIWEKWMRQYQKIRKLLGYQELDRLMMDREGMEYRIFETEFDYIVGKLGDTASMDKVEKEFFDNKVVRYIEHDDLHREVAKIHRGETELLFERFQKGADSVEMDRELFLKAKRSDQLNTVREEIMVLYMERCLIPDVVDDSKLEKLEKISQAELEKLHTKKDREKVDNIFKYCSYSDIGEFVKKCLWKIVETEGGLDRDIEAEIRERIKKVLSEKDYKNNKYGINSVIRYNLPPAIEFLKDPTYQDEDHLIVVPVSKEMREALEEDNSYVRQFNDLVCHFICNLCGSGKGAWLRQWCIDHYHLLNKIEEYPINEMKEFALSFSTEGVLDKDRFGNRNLKKLHTLEGFLEYFEEVSNKRFPLTFDNSFDNTDSEEITKGGSSEEFQVVYLQVINTKSRNEGDSRNAIDYAKINIFIDLDKVLKFCNSAYNSLIKKSQTVTNANVKEMINDVMMESIKGLINKVFNRSDDDDLFYYKKDSYLIFFNVAHSMGICIECIAGEFLSAYLFFLEFDIDKSDIAATIGVHRFNFGDFGYHSEKQEFLSDKRTVTYYSSYGDNHEELDYLNSYGSVPNELKDVVETLARLALGQEVDEESEENY